MKGQFIVKIGTDLLEFSDYDDIPESFDNVIVFKPDYPEPPHTEEQHNYISTFESKLKQLMERECLRLRG